MKTLIKWTIASVVVAIIAIPMIFVAGILWAWFHVPELPCKEDMRHA